MRRLSVRACGLFLAALALPVFAVGTATAANSTKTKKLAPATLTAQGATFPYGYYQVAIGDFKKVQKGITINYQPTGSGAGRTAFADQVADFAASDAPYSASTVGTVKGGPFFYFPTVAGPITVSFNLSGVSKLNLSADTIAKIFQRQIKTWDNQTIKAENPSAKLPSTAITVAHRSDGSGTTENFTKFLVKAAPGVWTLGSGSTVPWPSDTQGGAGNSGVAKIVQDTDGAIGYVDYSDAQAIGLTYASVKNAAGSYIAPTTLGASLSLEGATVNPDLTYDPINASGAKAYPITAPTWILVYQNQTDAKKGAAIKGFLKFIYGAGQKLAPTVDYAPLSKGLLEQAKAQLGKIVIPAG